MTADTTKTETAEPRFINRSNKLVYVTRPDGSDRVVRCFRELGVVAGRLEEDCVVVGEHYRKFSGLLEPFPVADAPAAIPAETKDVMDPNDRGVAARAMASGQFAADGEVVGPDGKVKYDIPQHDPAHPDHDPNFVPEPVDDAVAISPDAPTVATDPVDTVEPEAPPVEEEVEDKPLTKVSGIGSKLAGNLTAVGIETAAALADHQDEEQQEQLVEVPGVRNLEHAAQLVANAQELLGWEDAEDDADEPE